MTIAPPIAPPIPPSSKIDSPPPAPEPAGTESPLFLVVIADHAEAEQLSMLAELVTLASGQLLVAIASPRWTLTTDAAVLWRAAMGTPQEVEALAAAVDRRLAGRLTGYEVVELAYRGSPSAARRSRRLATAADRLARNRRAMHLWEWFPEIAMVERRAFGR